MFENLSEQAKTYVTYGATAITGAVVSAACIFLGLAVNRHYHPAPLAAKDVTSNILAATQEGVNVEALQRELNTLNGQTQALTDAQAAAKDRADRALEAFNTAQGNLTTAGTAAPESLRTTRNTAKELLDAANAALGTAQTTLAEHNKRKNELTAQLALNGVIANEGQRTVLVNIIKNLDPVFKAQAQAQAAAAAAAPTATTNP